jgi:hypothetical protein
MKIQFIVNAARWRDRINGNTYHSVRITRCEDGVQIVSRMQYGYGDHYRQTALEAMDNAGWLPEGYTGDMRYIYERENEYPISWNVTDGLKRNCIANGII